MKKAEKQEYVREVVAVGVFVVALCAVCAFMNGTGYVPFSVVCSVSYTHLTLPTKRIV